MHGLLHVHKCTCTGSLHLQTHSGTLLCVSGSSLSGTPEH
jgi:hypothetical protein